MMRLKIDVGVNRMPSVRGLRRLPSVGRRKVRVRLMRVGGRYATAIVRMGVMRMGLRAAVVGVAAMRVVRRLRRVHNRRRLRVIGISAKRLKRGLVSGCSPRVLIGRLVLSRSADALLGIDAMAGLAILGRPVG